MNSSSQTPQPENKQERQQAILTPAQWLQQQVLGPQPPGIVSLGELLLPSLLGAMETCWVDAIFIGLAGFGFLGMAQPLMPLWAPFVLLVGSQWLLYYRDWRAAARGGAPSPPVDGGTKIAPPETAILFSLVGVLALFLAWLQVYAHTAFLFDPRWLGALLSDALFLNIHFYQVIGISALSLYFSWRGLRLSSREIEPSTIFRILCLGLGIMIVVVVVRAEQESAGISVHDEAILLLLIPIFLFLSLAAHALARISFVRRMHPTGLQGNVIAQERAVITVIGSLGLVILLVTVLVALLASPAFLSVVLHALAPVGAALAIAYNWLVSVIALIAVVIATPFFWLLYLYTQLFPPKAPNPPQTQNKPHLKTNVIPHAPNPAVFLIPYIKVILPVVLVLGTVFLVWWALRRRRGRVRARQRSNEVRESLWSWALFWLQLRAFLKALFARFLPRRDGKREEQAAQQEEEIRGEPATRSIREIYRAFLKKAAYRGYPRKRDETPYEFRQRLDQKLPQIEPQLEVITEAYALTRYAGAVPDEAEVAQVRGAWTELDQKWV